jgi:hypothetical protein
VNGGGLDDAGNQGNDRCDGDGLLTAEVVCAPSCKEYTKNCAAIECADDSTLDIGREGMKILAKMLLCNYSGNDTRVDTVSR